MRRSGLTTSPCRNALVDTLIRFGRPSITALTVWRLGLKVRPVQEVTFVPTPPRYLARPRVRILLPVVVRTPVKWQTRGMAGRV